MDDTKISLKVAWGVVTLIVVAALVITLVLITRKPVNKMIDDAQRSIVSSTEIAASTISNYDKPIPVAAIWRVVDAMGGNIKKFAIKEVSSTNPNEWVLVSNKKKDLDNYMDRKAYMSWSIDKAGQYTVEVLLNE